MFKPMLAIAMTVVALIGPAMAQSAAAASPEGIWRDSYGTSFQFNFCGDGRDLCGVLMDIQGASRTEENLALVNQQVVQADQTSANQWKGTVIYGGKQATAIVTQVGENQIKIKGCQGGIFCQTLTFDRVS